MKRIFLLLFFASLVVSGFAQAQEASVQQTARDYMRSGDWDNAVLVLNRALQQEPRNLDYQKDLAMTYFYKRDYARALEQVKPMLERDDADVPVYQIAGNVYKAMEMVKDADKMYRKALKKFPNSGPLYSEYGELLWSSKDYNAIKLWEKGIEAAPSFAGNYYNAAVYYYYTKDKIWTILYGEIFVNMEYLTERATEMKKLLLSAYKEKLFSGSSNDNNRKQTDFEKAVLQTYNRAGAAVNEGMNIGSLTKLRTRFILDWFKTNAAKYPFRLFDYQQQLIREGMFEAYNQWLFGTVDNLPAFDQWTKTNAEVYEKFVNFQKGRVFKMPAGQHYQDL
jgi:tetratricopeptide (TPR) repeat protein